MLLDALATVAQLVEFDHFGLIGVDQTLDFTLLRRTATAFVRATLDEPELSVGILLTSNRAPGEWPELFDNPLLASAALDRLADRAHVVSVTGKSYRLTRTADGKEVPLSELTATTN